MNSEDLALLLGLVGGGFGGYFGSKRKEERERANKKQDALDAIELEKLLAEERKKIREEEEYEADTARFKREGRFTEGDRRGEIENPTLMDMFGAEYDPIHDFLEENIGLTAADLLTGTTAYDTNLPIEERIRNPESENFVENRSNNFLTDFGALPYAALIPGVAPALLGGTGAALGVGAGARGLAALGPKMMRNLSSYFSRPTGSSPMGPMGIFPGMNKGGRVDGQ